MMGGRARTLEDAVDTMSRVQLGMTLTHDEIGLIVDPTDFDRRIPRPAWATPVQTAQ